MHSVSIQTSQQHSNVSSRRIAIKAVIAVSSFIIAYTQLSSAQIFLLAMTGALLLALMNRIDNINAKDGNHHNRAARSSSFDGGFYNRKQQVVSIKKILPAVNDGGSFERSSMKSRKAA